MGRAAILKIVNIECMSAHPKDHYCEASLQLDQKQICFNFHCYHGNSDHFENFKA